MSQNPIGIFDSGIGGLTVAAAIHKLLPNESIIYVGDTAHLPYGDKSPELIEQYAKGITDYLLERGCKIIVIACNTASAASLKYLREKFPEVIFVGLEPAVKPATEITKTKRIGILATPMTFQGDLFNSSVDKYANGIEIFKNTCDGLVLEIEKGDFDGQRTKEILEGALYPMLEENVDTVVLGCTHYPLVIGEIKKIVGDKIRIIDPTPSIVRQVEKILEENNLSIGIKEKDGEIEIFTSGESEGMENVLEKLFGGKIKVEKINLENLQVLNMVE